MKGDMPRLLTPGEAGALFRVHPKTIARWSKAGKLTPVWTLGGRRRYLETELRNLLAVQSAEEGDGE